MSVDISSTMDLDSDDYVELYGYLQRWWYRLRIEPVNKSTNFGAYRIGT